jgi:parallel beta-helix repeat protein
VDQARAGARAVLFLVCGLATAPAGAADRYVSPTGSDLSVACSLPQPCREIRRALELVAPGETILVANGTYKGFDVDDVHGTPASPITIRALGSSAQILPTTDRSDNRDTIFVTFSSYIVIDGLRSFGANRAAVRVDESPSVTVRNGVFGDNFRWGIFTDFSDDLLIENNECYGSQNEHGIYVSNSGDRPVLRGNRVHDNVASGIQLNADLSSGGDGIITGALIEGNVIYGNGTAGGAAINLDGVQDSVVRNNLLYGNHATGIVNYHGDGAVGPSGMQILHNTVDQAADGRWALLIWNSDGPNVVRNNILYNRHPTRGSITYLVPQDVLTTDSDYNVMDKVTPDDDGIIYTLAQWQALGHEPHSVLPGSLASLFVNANGGDYHLPSGSPAVDAGQTLASVTVDLEGRPRPQGTAYDVGAYEKSAAAGFFTLTPCRVADTRNPVGPSGGPALAANSTRTFPVTGICAIPATAKAVAVNVTVVGETDLGDLRVYPAGSPAPSSSTINFAVGKVRANNALIPLFSGGQITVRCDMAPSSTGQTHFLLDVTGYFQ